MIDKVNEVVRGEPIVQRHKHTADSRHGSSWAAAIYDSARARGKDHPLAVRITARAWAYVIWRCWHDSAAYDPAKHNALQAILARRAAQQEDQ